MADIRYCYHCSTHHAEADMRQIDTKSGKRWRCIKSIDAAKQNRTSREAYGRQVTANNKTEASNRNKALLNPELSYRPLIK